MTTEPRSSTRQRGEDQNIAHYVAMGRSPGFTRLRRKFVRSTSVIAALFLGWYGFYIAMSVYGRSVMDTRVVGNINVGLVLGVAQFVSTFLLCWVRARYCRVALDPLAERLRAEIEGRSHPVRPTGAQGRHARTSPKRAPRPRLGDQS